MGNKVISISGTGSSKVDGSQPLEVYKDISIISERRNTTELIENKGPVTKQGFFVAKDVNVKAVFNSLRNIFSWIQGERILNPDFGSKLRTFLYEGITPENREQIAAEIKGVCLKWEPRVEIVKIVPVQSPKLDEDNTVQIDIMFTIPSLSKKQYQYSYIYNRAI